MKTAADRWFRVKRPAKSYFIIVSSFPREKNGKFTELTVVSAEKEDAAYFDAASSLLDTILEEQSTDVDTVSGATFSSNGIIHATEDALRKAEKSE